MNAKPDDIIHCQVSLKAGLLKGKVNNYGQTADYIRAALESYNKTKYGDGLILLIAEIRKTIEELELWRGEQEHENKIDPNNLMLLETYRDVYFRLKGAKILKRKIK
jgi:hypothetical protein